MNNLPITVLENKHNGINAIKLTEGAFSGIIYSYGKIEFDEDPENDVVKLNFEYDIIDYADKQLSDKKPFEQYIGDILVELIHQGISNNDLVYTGGVDENRTKDSEQSDS